MITARTRCRARKWFQDMRLIRMNDTVSVPYVRINFHTCTAFLRHYTISTTHMLGNKMLNLGAIRGYASAVVNLADMSNRCKISLVSMYDRDVEDGEITFDAIQYETVKELDRLIIDILKNYESFSIEKLGIDSSNDHNVVGDTSNDGFWGTIFSSTKELDNMIPPLENSTTNIKGVYIHGGVGCGKTHLMKLFYAALPNNLTKQNVHFHKFMLGIHKRMHTERKKHGSSLSGDSILNLVVNEILKDGKIICFDEFQVTGELFNI